MLGGNKNYEIEGDVLTRITVEWLLNHLAPEEQEILILHEIEELTFAEIGKIIGHKYRGRALTGSTIKYHKDKILARLRQLTTETVL
jgi:DNA-directed RNA polymerase specialized sigma24 family protein